MTTSGGATEGVSGTDEQARPAPDPVASQQAHWQAVVDDYQASRRLPTLVVGVLVGGRLGWVGMAGEPVPVDSQFRVGSITKTMTAVLVLQARDEGLLDLDDPVERHLPGAPYPDATVRQLLSHTSGMQSEPAGPWWERSGGQDWEQLVAANDGSGRVFPPGEQYHYSNLGFAVLGRLVAELRDAPWEELVRDRLWGPLGMTRTSLLPQQPHATGYSVDHLRGTLTVEPATDTGAMAPAGQVWSTVEDLAAFGGFLRDGHPDVLSADTLAEMARPQGAASTYGLGALAMPGATVFGHNGTMPGFQATLLVDRGSGTGAVALCNGTTGFAGPELLLRLFGSDTPVPGRPWQPTERVPDWADELVGWWYWGNSVYEVRWENGLLEFRDVARGGQVAEKFDRPDPEGPVVGVAGYHHGETLQVHRRDDGSVGWLECATFVYTRTPYDPEAPIPGGHPS